MISWDKWRKHVGLLIAALAFLAYANSLGNGHVWDDEAVILKNASLRAEPLQLFTRIDNVRATERTPYYRPLTLLTFLIEERLFGLNPFLMHLSNVLLHALNSYLVYRLALSIVCDGRAALVAGLLFAVHPINSESVNLLSARNTMLACCFVLAALQLHRRGKGEGKWSLAAAGAVCFLAGMLSKEIAVVILSFIVALEWDQLRTGNGTDRKQAVLRLAPYAAVLSLYGILRGMALSNAGVQIEIATGLGKRLLDNLYIIPRYLLNVVWPSMLSPQYALPENPHLLALPLAASWIFIIFLLGWLMRRGRSQATLFGLLWLGAFWMPVSGIISIPSAPLADRYLYVPAIGLWLIIADQVIRFTPTETDARRAAMYGGALILMLLMVVTIVQNSYWKSDITLFSRYVEKNPTSAFGHHNLGCAYLDKVGNLEAAEREFNKALALDPHFPRLRTQMGYVRLLRGDYEGAIRHYDEAVAQNPFDAEALLNRGIALDKLGRISDAVIDYRRFLATPWNELPDARPYAESRIHDLEQ